MDVVVGSVRIEDVEETLDELRKLGDRHDSVVQAIDARYVAGQQHLATATELARRARNRGEDIADDPALEILLYVAGTRQIDSALEIGLSPETYTAAIVIDGGAETAAANAVRESLIEDPADLQPDRSALMEWFDITETELGATGAPLEAVVCERVALLTIDR